MIHFKKISTNQLVYLIALNQIGVHVLTIPYSQSKYSGYDSWMSVLLGGIYAQLLIFVTYGVCKRFPNESIGQFIRKIIGKPVGKFLLFLLAIYCAESSLSVAVAYCDVLNRWVLFETPWSVTLGLIFLIAVYAATSSFRSIATISQTIFVMFGICTFIILVSAIGQGTFRHFLPIGAHGIGSIAKDSLSSFQAFAGFELLLYAFPFVACQKKKEILISSSIANGITTVFYVTITIIVTYNFSENQLHMISEPMVFILRKFRMPVMQSLDILFMTIWLSVALSTVFIYLFLSAKYVACVFRNESKNHTWLVWIIGALSYIIGLFEENRENQFKFIDYHHATTVLFVSIMPIFLYVFILFREKVRNS
ncbi:GerAB/ArcD/ProY family transporter [Gottfriedia acidiceleris]|uniref:GerAB/ArcD/ProY family transporter n=1 Tax=Gottfriedia acidiceleris TaxID=371036 RepID=UPI002F260D5B